MREVEQDIMTKADAAIQAADAVALEESEESVMLSEVVSETIVEQVDEVSVKKPSRKKKDD
jgi:hypothetical protein